MERRFTATRARRTRALHGRGRPWAYETAISHVDYNNGDWIALASAETKEEAAASHEDYLINHLSDRDRTFEDIYSGKEYTRAE